MAGMPMPKAKKLPQGDNSKSNRKVPATGPDDDPKKKVAGRETAPWLPERDGPAKDQAVAKSAQKPKTSAKTFAAMKQSLAKVK